MLLVSTGINPGYTSGYDELVELAFPESRTGTAKDLGHLGIWHARRRYFDHTSLRGGLPKGISD